MSGSSGWEKNEVEHTFASGKKAIIRRTLPLQWLVMRAVENDDVTLAAGLAEYFETGTVGANLDEDVAVEDATVVTAKVGQLYMAAKVERMLIESIFIRPRVWWDPEEMPEVPDSQNGDIPEHISAVDLTDGDMAEAMELATKGAADVTRFLGVGGGPVAGEGGEVLGDDPQPKPRAKSRKR